MQLNTKAALLHWITSGHRSPDGDNSCVEAVMKDDGVHVTSSIEGNDGKVVFTQQEWDAFLTRARTSGEWDHTLSAEARSALSQHEANVQATLRAAIREEILAELNLAKGGEDTPQS